MFKIFSKRKTKEDEKMKYLIVGLGNMDFKYKDTRHNIGFSVLDNMAKKKEIIFESKRLADKAEYKHKGRRVLLIKPSTYMNNSGRAVNYWIKKENIPMANLLVVVDDIALPLGKIRIRAKGGDGGHNGLISIQDHIHSSKYARLRFGIGNDFSKGKQVEHVLGKWNIEEHEQMLKSINLSCNLIDDFVFKGCNYCMGIYNSSIKTI